MTVNKSKRERLEHRGWKIGNADAFLDLSPEESRYVDLKLALSRRLRERREARKLTQTELARQLGSSQSRVAKMEAGDPSVSIDLLIRTYFVLGVSRGELARIITAPRRG